MHLENLPFNYEEAVAVLLFLTILVPVTISFMATKKMEDNA